MAGVPDYSHADYTLLALKVMHDMEFEGTHVEDDKLKEYLDTWLTTFQSALSKAEENNYDKAIIAQLLDSCTRLVTEWPRRKMLAVKASAAILERDLAVYQYLYGPYGNSITNGTEQGSDKNSAGRSEMSSHVSYNLKFTEEYFWVVPKY